MIALRPEAIRRERHCFVMLRMATFQGWKHLWISKQLKASNPKDIILELI
jgi:hypothetical protein